MSLFDITKRYTALDRPNDPLWIEQGGYIFMWSDLNRQYEFAWWVSPLTDAAPAYLVKIVDRLRSEHTAPDCWDADTSRMRDGFNGYAVEALEEEEYDEL